MHSLRAERSLNLAGTGGGDAPPTNDFFNGFQSTRRISLKFCIANGLCSTFGETILTGSSQVRSQSFDVIRRTTSDRFFTEIAFSAT